MDVPEQKAVHVSIANLIERAQDEARAAASNGHAVGDELEALLQSPLPDMAQILERAARLAEAVGGYERLSTLLDAVGAVPETMAFADAWAGLRTLIDAPIVGALEQPASAPLADSVPVEGAPEPISEPANADMVAKADAAESAAAMGGAETDLADVDAAEIEVVEVDVAEVDVAEVVAADIDAAEIDAADVESGHVGAVDVEAAGQEIVAQPESESVDHAESADDEHKRDDVAQTATPSGSTSAEPAAAVEPEAELEAEFTVSSESSADAAAVSAREGVAEHEQDVSVSAKPDPEATVDGIFEPIPEAVVAEDAVAENDVAEDAIVEKAIVEKAIVDDEVAEDAIEEVVDRELLAQAEEPKADDIHVDAAIPAVVDTQATVVYDTRQAIFGTQQRSSGFFHDGVGENADEETFVADPISPQSADSAPISEIIDDGMRTVAVAAPPAGMRDAIPWLPEDSAGRELAAPPDDYPLDPSVDLDVAPQLIADERGDLHYSQRVLGDSPEGEDGAHEGVAEEAMVEIGTETSAPLSVPVSISDDEPQPAPTRRIIPMAELAQAVDDGVLSAKGSAAVAGPDAVTRVAGDSDDDDLAEVEEMVLALDDVGDFSTQDLERELEGDLFADEPTNQMTDSEFSNFVAQGDETGVFAGLKAQGQRSERAQTQIDGHGAHTRSSGNESEADALPAIEAMAEPGRARSAKQPTSMPAFAGPDEPTAVAEGVPGAGMPEDFVPLDEVIEELDESAIEIEEIVEDEPEPATAPPPVVPRRHARPTPPPLPPPALAGQNQGRGSSPAPPPLPPPAPATSEAAVADGTIDGEQDGEDSGGKKRGLLSRFFSKT